MSFGSRLYTLIEQRNKPILRRRNAFCRSKRTRIMHHPLSHTHRKGMILCDSQIVHHLDARYNLPACHDPDSAIGSQDMHAQVQLRNGYKTSLQGKEGMLLIGVNDLTRLRDDGAMGRMGGRSQGQVYQIVVVVDPHMQHRFQFHLVRLRIVG